MFNLKELSTILNNINEDTKLIHKNLSQLKRLIQTSNEAKEETSIEKKKFEEEEELAIFIENLNTFESSFNLARTELIEIKRLIEHKQNNNSLEYDLLRKFNNNSFNEDQMKQLNEIESELRKLESNLNDPASIIYEECSELIRLIQLHTEETIAKAKKDNDFDINIDDSELDEYFKCQINELQVKSESLIEQVEKHEKEYMSSYSTKEAHE